MKEQAQGMTIEEAQAAIAAGVVVMGDAMFGAQLRVVGVARSKRGRRAEYAVTVRYRFGDVTHICEVLPVMRTAQQERQGTA